MIELQNVSKRFGNVDAVRDISLRVEAGEFVTLLGPSGCGKTTLLRMIAGFEAPTSGQILLEGADVTSLPPYRRDVNQVFQSYALFPHLSVRDNIGFGLRMKHVSREEARTRIAEAVEMVELKGLEHRRPSQLSGGQQQRVALARALVCRPKVLLLDEPMAALDAALRRNMQVELKNLQQRLGITFLFVTHDQGEALLLSDRIAVMNAGAVEQFDTAVQVYTKPATPFVARFIGQANVMEASVVSSDGPTSRMRTKFGTELLVSGSHSGDVCLAIRSESIRLHDSPIGAPNVLPGKVRQILFGGASSQYTLQTDSGMPLTASGPPGAIRVGDAVWCEIDPKCILVLPRSPGPSAAQ